MNADTLRAPSRRREDSESCLALASCRGMLRRLAGAGGLLVAGMLNATGALAFPVSTKWNFHDVLGAGYTIGGPHGSQEIGARWVHVSNGGLKKPNPGENFLQLRYAQRF